MIPAFGDNSPTEDEDGDLYSFAKKTVLSEHIMDLPHTVSSRMSIVSHDQLASPSALSELTAYRWFIEYGARFGTNWQNISTARMEGINTHFGSATSDDTVDEIDYYGLGQIISMTSNDEVNSLALLNFSKVFGIKSVYQLTPIEFKETDGNNLARRLRGKYLFGPTYNFMYLDNLVKEGFVVKTTNITVEYNIEEMKRQYNRSEIISLIVISKTNLIPLMDDKEVSLKPGEILLSLINPD